MNFADEFLQFQPEIISKKINVTIGGTVHFMYLIPHCSHIIALAPCFQQHDNKAIKKFDSIDNLCNNSRNLIKTFRRSADKYWFETEKSSKNYLICIVKSFADAFITENFFIEIKDFNLMRCSLEVDGESQYDGAFEIFLYVSYHLNV